MMFLVIFGSLAAAMAIVSQGNLATADSHLKINRSLAAAETGMRFITHHLSEAAASVKTREGDIDAATAAALWTQASQALVTALADDYHYASGGGVVTNGTTIEIGPIAVGPGAPTFTATLTPHPLPGEDYTAAFYQRPPYDTMDLPLDARWVRVKVVAADGKAGHQVHRSISMDFRITKKIPYAILSKSRVMIGRNVMIDGPIGSRFVETNLDHGHPIQMASDFRGLNPDLDADLDVFIEWLKLNDANHDNRLYVGSGSESAGIPDIQALDLNSDGYLDEYDFFLHHFDTDGNPGVSTFELEAKADNPINAQQLLTLIDTFGDPGRPGYNDGVIDARDRYAKIRGQVYLTADMQGWNDGAAGGDYQDHFQGPIDPRFGKPPMTFEADQNDAYQFEPSDFDVSNFRAKATGDLYGQAATQAANHDPNNPASPKPMGEVVLEAVPYGAAHPYDFYDRPLFENMTFTNVTIPKGTNALFRNCTFIGVTFIDTATSNTDPNYNYAGMQESDGSQKHPDRTAVVGGEEVGDTKLKANNIRFDNCTFEGAVVTPAAEEYTHVRNKLSFTGETAFVIENSTHLSAEEKRLYKRSTILAPQYSVELGTFVSPTDSGEVLELSGTIVAGILDMRGQVKVNGTILTTFEPTSNVGPVIGETSPQFNTTLGYFGSESGDLEAEIPEFGVGVIQVTYDPTLPVPDGINGPIQIEPVVMTYSEGGR